MASLAACSTPASTDTAAACKPTASGKVSEAVKVTGKVGEAPTVKITSPATVTATQRTVVTKGDGAVAEEGNDVKVEYSMYSGKTGTQLDASTYDGTTVTFPLDGTLIAGLTKVLTCTTAGSRVVGVMAASDGLETVLTNYGLDADDSLVFVADVVSTEKPAAVVAPLAKADGKDQALPADFPKITVKLADDGTPTITLPGGTAPKELQLAVLKKGTGKTVEAGTDVVVQYVGMNWRTKKVFDESWSTGSPATFNTGGVVAGFRQALEGQTVGSQVLVTIPPDLGYGTTGNDSAGIKGTDTIVFVVDILGLG